MNTEDEIKKFHVKTDDREKIREKSFAMMRGLDYEDEFATENLKIEEKRQQQLAKIQQERNRRIKMRKFRKILISLAVVASLGAGAGLYHKEYINGYDDGSRETEEEFKEEHLRTYSIDTAPDVILNAYADNTLAYLQRTGKNIESEYGTSDNQYTKNYESIKSGSYVEMMRNYYNYTQTGSEEDYGIYRDSAKKFNDVAADIGMGFEDSELAYSVLLDSNGNIMDGNPKQDDDYSIYIATDYVSNPNNEFTSNDIIVGDIIYSPFESETEKLIKSK